MTSFLESLDRALTAGAPPSSARRAGDAPETRAELIAELRRQVCHARAITSRGHTTAPVSPDRTS
jgi:hypothetical protein